MLIAVDAATVPGSVAVLRAEETLASLDAPPDPRVDAWLIGAIDRCLEAAGQELDGVRGFAVTIGPGTFTGIRVGIATCSGLATPRALPVAGVQTLEALAEAGRDERSWVAACLDARRGQVYAALYRLPTQATLPLATVWGPTVCDPDAFLDAMAASEETLLVVGNGCGRLADAGLELHEEAGPLAVAAGRLAARSWNAGPDGLPPAEPFYLRPPDARPPRSPLDRPPP